MVFGGLGLAMIGGLLAIGAAAFAAAPPAAKGTGQSDGPREMTVAADGSGDYRTLQEAINAAPTGTRRQPTVIHIKPGTYKEVLYIQREKRFLHLVGEDAAKTMVTYDLYAGLPGLDGKPIGTFRTATALIDADDLTAQNLTFENAAGPKGQALALRVDGDRVAFRHCRFLGWQDTILDNRGRHYYEDCDITGATDFIFGGGTAFFDRCRLHCAGSGYVTAASTPEEQPFGFVFRDCAIDGAAPDVKTYLGRPWRDYASVVFVNTQMSEVVRPEGWSDWGKTARSKTARYAEFGSHGPGADPKTRVPWMKMLTESQVAALTPKNVLSGADGWDPLAETPR